MVKLAFFYSVMLTIVMASSPSYSTTVNCERTTYSHEGYLTQQAFESWWPKNLGLDGDKFKEAGSGSKAMVYKNTGGENDVVNNNNAVLFDNLEDFKTIETNENSMVNDYFKNMGSNLGVSSAYMDTYNALKLKLQTH